jgi:hypothetical protein
MAERHTRIVLLVAEVEEVTGDDDLQARLESFREVAWEALDTHDLTLARATPFDVARFAGKEAGAFIASIPGSL